MVNNYVKVVVDGYIRAAFSFDDTDPDELNNALDRAEGLGGVVALYRLPEYDHPRLDRIRVTMGCGARPHLHDIDPDTGEWLPCVRCHARATRASKRRAA